MTAIPTGSQQRKTRTVRNLNNSDNNNRQLSKDNGGRRLWRGCLHLYRGTRHPTEMTASPIQLPREKIQQDGGGARPWVWPEMLLCIHIQSPKVRARVSRAHAWHVLHVQSGLSFVAIVWWRNFNWSSRQKLTGENQSFVTKDKHTQRVKKNGEFN